MPISTGRIAYFAIFIAATLSCAPLRAHSQVDSASSLKRGDRVRTTAESPSGTTNRTGTVLSISPDTLVMLGDGSGDSIAYALSDVSKLEVSRGLHGSALRGALTGAVLGGGIGVVVGLGSCADSCELDKSAEAEVFGTLGALVGAVVGGIIGAHDKSESFERVGLPAPALRAPAGGSASDAAGASLDSPSLQDWSGEIH